MLVGICLDVIPRLVMSGDRYGLVLCDVNAFVCMPVRA